MEAKPGRQPAPLTPNFKIFQKYMEEAIEKSQLKRYSAISVPANSLSHELCHVFNEKSPDLLLEKIREKTLPKL